ncbi:hypothetical protein GGE12_007354 [Rhizobium mongolense]|uniref:Uncharacterized protein n=1 Tax=Rhizobium mongolense TaxID=57676 RepID=A0A7W6RVQ7_9HYPH|nr:hypothetical protein [Rhizobium mongolense]
MIGLAQIQVRPDAYALTLLSATQSNSGFA